MHSAVHAAPQKTLLLRFTLVHQSLELHFDIHPGWEVQLHELIDCLRCQVLNVHHPLVCPCLKVLPRVLVHMW